MLCVVGGLAHAADVSGTWTASFDTQVGKQEYTYTLKVEGTALTGTAKSNLIGDSTLSDGKVDGNKISFIVELDFGGMSLVLNYSGVVSPAEIKFTLDVMGMPFEFAVSKNK
jgi:hypothetical protein